MSGDGWGEASETEMLGREHWMRCSAEFLRERKIKSFCLSTDLTLTIFPRNVMEFASGNREFSWVKTTNSGAPEWLDYVGTREDGFTIRINYAEQVPQLPVAPAITAPLFPEAKQ